MTLQPLEATSVSISRQDAQRLATRELAKSQYHEPANAPSGTYTDGGGLPTNQPTASATSAPPPTQQPTNTHVSTILVVVVGAILLVILVLLVLRHFGRPRSEARSAGSKKPGAGAGSAFDELLVGAAAHRRDAALAAGRGDWAEAIRERFRAVIATLDERGLLPERADRTADEAARDAGYVLPVHADALSTAARAFDDVEYGAYHGTREGHAVIGAVDDQVANAQATVSGVGAAAASREENR
jgi:Domain of unknown function (DUF4129)